MKILSKRLHRADDLITWAEQCHMIPQNGAHLCSSDVYGGNVGYWEYKHTKQESSE